MKLKFLSGGGDRRQECSRKILRAKIQGVVFYHFTAPWSPWKGKMKKKRHFCKEASPRGGDRGKIPFSKQPISKSNLENY